MPTTIKEVCDLLPPQLVAALRASESELITRLIADKLSPGAIAFHVETDMNQRAMIRTLDTILPAGAFNRGLYQRAYELIAKGLPPEEAAHQAVKEEQDLSSEDEIPPSVDALTPAPAPPTTGVKKIKL